MLPAYNICKCSFFAKNCFTSPHCKCYNTAIHMNPGAAFAARFSAFRFYVDFLIHAIKTWFIRFIPLRLFLHHHRHFSFQNGCDMPIVENARLPFGLTRISFRTQIESTHMLFFAKPISFCAKLLLFSALRYQLRIKRTNQR